MEVDSRQQNEKPPFKIPPSECLIEIGHSIGLGGDGNWYLSRLLQPADDAQAFPDGGINVVRKGLRTNVTKDQKNAIVAGGVITTAATVEAYSELAERNMAPKVVVHTGGRPKYLEEAAPSNPTLTEAKLMGESFNRRFIYKNPHLSLPVQAVIEEGKTTEDDIRNGLEMALKHECSSATFVGLDIRLARCKAWYEKIIGETDKYNGITVNFLPAENVIANIAFAKGRIEQWETVLRDYHESEAYKKTLELEQGGIQAIKSNTYKGTKN